MTRLPVPFRSDVQLIERALTTVASVGMAGFFWAVLVSNDPHRVFTRFRAGAGAFGLLVPDWRFFAPNPSDHDYELVYRVRTRSGDTTQWDHVFRFAERTWGHALFYARRRREKGVFDTIQSMISSLPHAPVDALVSRAPYRVLESFVAHEVRRLHADELPEGFQFAIVRTAGYDERPDLHSLFVSTYIPLTAAPARPLQR